MNWYPQNKEELERVIDSFLIINSEIKENVNGIIVPHAGYDFSGKIAGGAFSMLPKKEKAIVLGPSHYASFKGISGLDEIETPLGKLKTNQDNYPEVGYEHSIENQIPFLQKLGFSEITSLVIGKIDEEEAKNIAKELANKKDSVFIFSTDLSHFLSYEDAINKDKKTIDIIKNLDVDNWKNIDACGIYPLLILINLCKIKCWTPHLIEYKNSGDITRNKKSVVGYSSFWF
jgi:hypothetical protein